MEGFVFNSEKVEDTLDEIRGAFIILSYAIYGLLKQDMLSRQEFSAFENVVNKASLQVDDLMKGLRPLKLDEETLKRLKEKKEEQ